MRGPSHGNLCTQTPLYRLSDKRQQSRTHRATGQKRTGIEAARKWQRTTVEKIVSTLLRSSGHAQSHVSLNGCTGSVAVILLQAKQPSPYDQERPFTFQGSMMAQIIKADTDIKKSPAITIFVPPLFARALNRSSVFAGVASKESLTLRNFW